MVDPPFRFDDLIDLVKSDPPEGGALDHLAGSVLLAGHIGEMADHLIRHFVDQARSAGASWAEIGDALGVTKQAAQKRFAARKMQDGKQTPFARFNEEARAVVMESRKQARTSGHDQIDTGHIVLALVANPDGLAARAMSAQGVSPDEVRAVIQEAIGPPSGDGPLPDHIPWASDAKKVLDLLVRWALRRQDGNIGPEHILLAVLRHQKSLGAITLAGLGVSRREIEKGIAR